MSRFETYPTIITPFSEDGQIDYPSLKKLIALFAECACDGVFGVCQSSEMFYLSDDEKLELARFTLNACRESGMKCVISGHTQTDLQAQIAYLKRLEELEPDAIILVSNRLAREGEGDDIALANLSAILGALGAGARLGVYECPYPYKRPLTPALLGAMAADGRFRFVKDTCCEIETIKARLGLISDSGMALYNANMATLMESADAGAAGYSGVMLNLMPEYFELLKNARLSGDNARAALITRHLTGASIVECQNYPANAKYCLKRRGVINTTVTRNSKPALTESQRKELDAFVETNTHMYFALAPHAPYTLLSAYNEHFPECHASTVLPLAGGRVLVAYFAGTREKADDVGIWLSVYDGGAWRKPREIAKLNNTPHWNPVLFETGRGARLVFKAGRTIEKWASYTMLSEDGGETWSPPEAYGADNPAGGPVRGKPILLSDGRLLAPNSDESQAGWYPRVDISDDGGKTFKRLAPIPINRAHPAAPDYMPGVGAIQPALWESAPGRVHALLRTNAGAIYRSDSEDGGATWSVAYPTKLPNNNSGIDIERVNEDLYLVMNPVRSPKGPRTPLVMLRSNDNGLNFKLAAVLADELMDETHHKDAQFAYPAIAARDGALYISFTHNRKSIAFTKIPLEGD